MKCPIRIRIDVAEDPRYNGHGIGKKYTVTKWVFEKKTGRTVDHGSYGTGYSWKEAQALKAKIKRAYGV